MASGDTRTDYDIHRESHALRWTHSDARLWIRRPLHAAARGAAHRHAARPDHRDGLRERAPPDRRLAQGGCRVQTGPIDEGQLPVDAGGTGEAWRHHRRFVLERRDARHARVVRRPRCSLPQHLPRRVGSLRRRREQVSLRAEPVFPADADPAAERPAQFARPAESDSRHGSRREPRLGQPLHQASPARNRFSDDREEPARGNRRRSSVVREARRRCRK